MVEDERDFASTCSSRSAPPKRRSTRSPSRRWRTTRHCVLGADPENQEEKRRELMTALTGWSGAVRQPVAHDHSQGGASATRPSGARVDVLHVGGLHYAGEKTVVEGVLGRRPGVLSVDANPAAQTAAVTYDPAVTSLEELAGWVEDCGYHCAGRSVPGHICDPMAIEGADAPAADTAAEHRAEQAHGGGHGGHAGMSMEAMARDMRNRFVVALAFAIPIVLWSPLGTDVLGVDLATPAGTDRDLWQFLLSLPVIFYSSWIFFRGAWIALRSRTLDMMVLVAVAIGTGWIYSVAATFWIEGEVFYEAAALLAAFVLLGHWLEMRAVGAPTTPSARCWTSRRRGPSS